MTPILHALFEPDFPDSHFENQKLAEHNIEAGPVDRKPAESSAHQALMTTTV